MKEGKHRRVNNFERKKVRFQDKRYGSNLELWEAACSHEHAGGNVLLEFKESSKISQALVG